MSDSRSSSWFANVNHVREETSVGTLYRTYLSYISRGIFMTFRRIEYIEKLEPTETVRNYLSLLKEGTEEILRWPNPGFGVSRIHNGKGVTVSVLYIVLLLNE